MTKIKWNLKLSPNAKKFVKEYSSVNERNEFSIKIDITNLTQNSVNYGEIIGFDSSHLIWGPLFYFSITVIIPKQFNETEKINEIIELNSTLPYRLFIPPLSFDYCGICVKLKNLEENSKATVQIQCVMNETEELNFDKKDTVRQLRFLIFDHEDIHEVCIILDDEKIAKNLQFQFELCFFKYPKFIPTLALFLKKSKKEETISENSDDSDGDNLITMILSVVGQIKQILLAQKIKFKSLHGKKYFITTYYFTGNFKSY